MVAAHKEAIKPRVSNGEVEIITSLTLRSAIDDVLSLDNTKFGDFVERIYPIELEIKDTTDTVKSASYLDLHLAIDNEGRLKNKTVRQKR